MTTENGESVQATERSEDAPRANPDAVPGFAHAFDCTHDPCLCEQTPPRLGSGDRASCGHPNPVWFTDHRLWNEVMGGDPDREAAGILCPSCFGDRADERFADGGEWRIVGWQMVPELGRVPVGERMTRKMRLFAEWQDAQGADRTKEHCLVDPFAPPEFGWPEALAGAVYAVLTPHPEIHETVLWPDARLAAEAVLRTLGLTFEVLPYVVALADEVGRQDAIHPAGYPATRDGQRIGIAAAEDELAEVKEAWRAARCKCPTPNCGHHDWTAMHVEAIQVAAVLLRMVRGDDDGAPS